MFYKSLWQPGLECGLSGGAVRTIVTTDQEQRNLCDISIKQCKWQRAKLSSDQIIQVRIKEEEIISCGKQDQEKAVSQATDLRETTVAKPGGILVVEARSRHSVPSAAQCSVPPYNTPLDSMCLEKSQSKRRTLDCAIATR
jgi:hypothetical protein